MERSLKCILEDLNNNTDRNVVKLTAHLCSECLVSD